MYLRLQTVELVEKFLNYLSWDAMTEHLVFGAIALDKEGEELFEKLSKFVEGEIIEVKDIARFRPFEGYCKIVRLDIKPPEDFNIAPLIYRFEGELEQVK